MSDMVEFWRDLALFRSTGIITSVLVREAHYARRFAGEAPEISAGMRVPMIPPRVYAQVCQAEEEWGVWVSRFEELRWNQKGVRDYIKSQSVRAVRGKSEELDVYVIVLLQRYLIVLRDRHTRQSITLILTDPSAEGPETDPVLIPPRVIDCRCERMIGQWLLQKATQCWPEWFSVERDTPPGIKFDET